MMKIRKARKSDIKQIVNLFVDGFSEKPYNECWTEKNALNKIKDYYNSGEILVIIESRTVIGFVIYHQMLWDNHNKLYIDEMVVDKAYRRKGIGTKLLNEVEKKAKEDGISNLELVSNTDSVAFKLYKDKGYEENGLVIMEKKL